MEFGYSLASIRPRRSRLGRQQGMFNFIRQHISFNKAEAFPPR